MQKKEMSGAWGKVVVTSVTVFSVFMGNVVAKAADIPVNQMFAKNVEVVKVGDLEVVETVDFVWDDMVTFTAPTDTSSFVEFALNNTETVEYEIIYNTDSEPVVMEEQFQTEPRHVHEMVEIILKEHEKYKDGSCKTTYYEAGKCHSCGKIWKGNVTRTVSDTKCRH